jgi:hypothetical protein
VSRADRREVPPPPRLARAIRQAAIDLYYHSVRLVSANVVWGILVLATLWIGLTTPLALVVGVLAQVPLGIGIQNMATSVIRGDNTVMSDLLVAIREPRPLLALGVGQLVIVIVALTDAGIGLSFGGPLGAFLAATAVYVLFILWALSLACWPILLDPVRSDLPVSARLRLGVTLALAHPIRFSLLALVALVFLAASTLLAAMLVTVSIAFTCLVAARYVLPAADRLEGRATVVATPDEA